MDQAKDLHNAVYLIVKLVQIDSIKEDT
jgi:hypothetical protein